MAVSDSDACVCVWIGGNAMIQIYGDYYLSADSLQFILMRKIVAAPSASNKFVGGNVSYKAVGYFQRMEKVFERVATECEKDILQDENVKTITDFIDRTSGIIGTLEGIIHRFENVKHTDICETTGRGRKSAEDDGDEDDM